MAPKDVSHNVPVMYYKEMTLEFMKMKSKYSTHHKD